MPRHIPDGHHSPTILATNPLTHAPIDVPTHPSNAVCTHRPFAVLNPFLPHPQPFLHRPLPSSPPPPETSPVTRRHCPFPQPCKTARDGRSSCRIPGLHIPHTPSARPPNSSSPRTSYDDRRERPS